MHPAPRKPKAPGLHGTRSASSRLADRGSHHKVINVTGGWRGGPGARAAERRGRSAEAELRTGFGAGSTAAPRGARRLRGDPQGRGRPAGQSARLQSQRPGPRAGGIPPPGARRESAPPHRPAARPRSPALGAPAEPRTLSRARVRAPSKPRPRGPRGGGPKKGHSPPAARTAAGSRSSSARPSRGSARRVHKWGRNGAGEKPAPRGRRKGEEPKLRADDRKNQEERKGERAQPPPPALRSLPQSSVPSARGATTSRGRPEVLRGGRERRACAPRRRPRPARPGGGGRRRRPRPLGAAGDLGAGGGGRRRAGDRLLFIRPRGAASCHRLRSRVGTARGPGCPRWRRGNLRALRAAPTPPPPAWRRPLPPPGWGRDPRPHSPPRTGEPLCVPTCLCGTTPKWSLTPPLPRPPCGPRRAPCRTRSTYPKGGDTRDFATCNNVK
nr:basic salivary proline-rich protein 1-like [Equus asinus]